MTAHPPQPSVPMPISPGAEMRQLERFFPDVTWDGAIVAGGMGPGSPAMRATGQGVHRWIQGGIWVIGDYVQQQYLEDGAPVLRWELHWVAGWDPDGHTYVATTADNYGHATLLTGRIEGDRLVFVSSPELPVRIRLTWDASAPEALTWRNEVSLDGQAWQLVEEYRMRPQRSPASAAPRTASA